MQFKWQEKNKRSFFKTKVQRQVTQSRRFGEENRNFGQQMQIIYRTKLHVAAKLFLYAFIIIAIEFILQYNTSPTEGLREKMAPLLSSPAGHPASCSGTGTPQQPAASAAAQTCFILVTAQLSTFLSSMQTSSRQE